MVKKNKQTAASYSNIISGKVYKKDDDKFFLVSVVLSILGFLILVFIVYIFWAFTQVI
jgi:hypothetical protein